MKQMRSIAVVTLIATTVGALIGEWWVQRIELRRARARFRVVTERDLLSPSGRELSSQASRTGSVTPARREIDEPSVAKRLSMRAAKRGAALNSFLYGADHFSVGFDSPRYVGGDERRRAQQEEQERALVKTSRRVLLDRLEDMFRQGQRIGASPWERERFQIVGAVGAVRPVSIVGASFEIPASPAKTLEWHILEGGGTLPSEAGQERALLAIRDYEAKRRVLVTRIAERMTRLLEAQTAGSPEPTVGYAVKNHRLVLVSRHEVPEISGVLEAAKQLDEGYLNALKALVER